MNILFSIIVLLLVAESDNNYKHYHLTCTNAPNASICCNYLFDIKYKELKKTIVYRDGVIATFINNQSEGYNTKILSICQDCYFGLNQIIFTHAYCDRFYTCNTTVDAVHSDQSVIKNIYSNGYLEKLYDDFCKKSQNIEKDKSGKYCFYIPVFKASPKDNDEELVDHFYYTSIVSYPNENDIESLPLLKKLHITIIPVIVKSSTDDFAFADVVLLDGDFISNVNEDGTPIIKRPKIFLFNNSDCRLEHLLSKKANYDLFTDIESRFKWLFKDLIIKKTPVMKGFDFDYDSFDFVDIGIKTSISQKSLESGIRKTYSKAINDVLNLLKSKDNSLVNRLFNFVQCISFRNMKMENETQLFNYGGKTSAYSFISKDIKAITNSERIIIYKVNHLFVYLSIVILLSGLIILMIIYSMFLDKPSSLKLNKY